MRQFWQTDGKKFTTSKIIKKSKTLNAERKLPTSYARMSNTDITKKNSAQEGVCLGKKVNQANCVKWKMYMAVDKLCAPNK